MTFSLWDGQTARDQGESRSRVATKLHSARRAEAYLVLRSSRSLHMPLHTGFPIGLELLQFALLIGSEKLEKFVVDAGLFYLHLHQSLRLLRDQSLHLGSVVGAFLILPQLLLHLVKLQHHWFQSGPFFLQNSLHLRLLLVGRIQVLCIKLDHVSVHPESAMHSPMRGRRGRSIRGLRFGDRRSQQHCQRGGKETKTN